MKETLRRRLTVELSFNEISSGQQGGGKGEEAMALLRPHPYCSPTPFYSRLLERYLKTKSQLFFIHLGYLLHSTEPPQKPLQGNK
jgi:hypothetical protein